MNTPKGSALLTASQKPFLECVQLLLQAGADVNRFRHQIDLCTPLISAAANGFTKTTELLLKAGADVNFVNYKGNMALLSVSFHADRFTQKEMIPSGFGKA